MPQVTLDDLSLKDFKLTSRVPALRDWYFRAMPEICPERARLITRFSLDNNLLKQSDISILDKARTYRYVLENRDPIVRHSRAYEKGMKPFTFKEAPLFAGSTTSKFKGVPLYPEFLALTLWPELWSVSKRASNPYQISKKDVEELNRDIFPAWMDHTILELTRKQCYEDNWKKQNAGAKHLRGCLASSHWSYLAPSRGSSLPKYAPSSNRTPASGFLANGPSGWAMPCWPLLFSSCCSPLR